MKKIFYLILVTTLLISCEEFLELPPVDEISSNQFWNTRTDLENYMLQFYPLFPFNGHLGYIGHDAYSGGSDHQIDYVPENQLNGSRTIVTSGGGWDWRYIRSVNIFFENYSKALNNETFENIQHFVGEAHFFKAWLYFEKVRQFGDVPWFTKSMLMDSPELYNKRDLRTMVVDSILWHLDKAEANMKYLKDASGGSNRLSKEAALIFKSRVALFEGTWQKYHAGTPFGTPGANPNKYFQAAVDAVTELMTPSKYKVGIYNTGKPESDYSVLFTSNDLSSITEVVLWKRFSQTLKLTHNLPASVLANDEVCITNQLIMNYLQRDGSAYDYIDTGAGTKGIAFLTKIAEDCDPRLSQVISTPGAIMWTLGSTGYFTRPYLYASGSQLNITGYQLRKGLDIKVLTGSIAWNNTHETGMPIFRYAEALLNYAEAQYELGQPVDYAKSIDLLRARAGIPAFTVISDARRSYYADFGYPVSDELYEIRRERAVEFACEGFRFNDWRRWRAHNLFLNKRPKGFPYLATDYADYPNLVIKTDADGLVDPFQTVLPDGYQFNAGRDYLDCIPTNEITLNPELTQNPGW